jgi:hypothetical protein
MNMTPTQEKTAQTEQKQCSIKITSILQQLKNDGLQNINDDFIQEWCLPLPPYVTDAAQELVLRLSLLYTLLEDWKLSLALTYNPLMTAMGYTYEGYEFGWKTDGGCRSQTWSTLPSSYLQLSSDATYARKYTYITRRIMYTWPYTIRTYAGYVAHAVWTVYTYTETLTNHIHRYPQTRNKFLLWCGFRQLEKTLAQGKNSGAAACQLIHELCSALLLGRRNA